MQSCKSHGLTLIEVVVAILLLSTLLVTVMSAGSAHLRQCRLAQRRMEAIQLLDRLLLERTRDNSRWKPGTTGSITDKPNIAWKCYSIPSSLETIDLQLVRIELTETGQPEEKPLAHVEIVVPRP